MLKLQDKVFSVIKGVDPKFIATICGSFRRGIYKHINYGSKLEITVVHMTLYFTSHCCLLSGAASSGDIDILLGHPDYTSESKSKPPYIKSVVGVMEKDGFVTDTLSAGDSKFMVHCMTTCTCVNALVCIISCL